MTIQLYIGQKNYSSWSLRPWLVLKWAGIAFDEVLIPLDQQGYGRQSIAEILAVSPNGTVPALSVDGDVIWDSLAIAEWAAEQATDLWPSEARTRAAARSVVCEMHSGFVALRRDLPMNIKARKKIGQWPEDTGRNIERIEAIWTQFRSHHNDKGPWLFGQRSVADAFFTPVATRMMSYGVSLKSAAAEYCETLLNDAAFLEWEAACIPNSWDSPGYPVIDALYK